jgi:hypothetical protein
LVAQKLQRNRNNKQQKQSGYSATDADIAVTVLLLLHSVSPSASESLVAGARFVAKMLRSKSLLWGLQQFFQQKFEHHCFALMPIMMASGGVRSAGPSFHYVRWDHDATQRGACACAHMAGQGAVVDSTSQQYILTSFVQDYTADSHISGQRIMRASRLHRVNSGAAVCVSAFNAAAVHASWCVLCVYVGVCNSTGTIATAEVRISASV